MNELSLSLQIAGPAALALASLTPSQTAFIRALPKAELHAHLNGSIPLSTLHALAHDHQSISVADPAIMQGLEVLERGVVLTEISDFFSLFPAIYALTSTPSALRTATKAVLSHFLDPSPIDGFAECTYIELRTGPRRTAHMTRRQYLEVVLEEVERFSEDQAALIVALDRPMPDEDMREVLDLAIALKKEGRRVVGIDLCGNPFSGDVGKICGHITRAKDAGLGVTLHVAETTQNPPEETMAFLDTLPDRLGHATFLNEDAKQRVIDGKIGIELCLTSNALTKTVPSLADHHIMWYIARQHPVVICTDDILPFRTSLTAEYALLMAQAPLGLGLGEEAVRSIATSGMNLRLGGHML